MNDKTKKILLIVVSIIALVLLVRVVFDKQFDDFDRYVEERENSGDPEAYDRNLEKLGEWVDDYKEEHPGATDEDVERAWNEAWGN